MKKIIILGLLFAATIVSAVDHYAASGINVAQTQRDTMFYYHNNCDDQHWFGADSWAVKFEFNELFAEINSLYFEADGANIFIPGTNGADPLTLKICADSVGQPKLGSLNFTQTLQASEISYNDWNFIPFTNTITDSTIWMVVDYPTNSTEQFISASATGGSQSYYWDGDQFSSMYSISYDSEFLFSLQGRILFEGTDLDLVEVSWSGEFIPDSSVYPKFVVKNNADVEVVGSYILPSLSSPHNDLELIDVSDSSLVQQIDLPVLEANETYYFDYNGIYKYRLLNSPSQYLFEAELICETDSLSFNNVLEKDFNTFIEQQDYVLIENAVRLNGTYSSDLLLDQSDIASSDSSLVLNYFAMLADEPFYNLDSYTRFNYYDLMGFPATMVNGADKIIGYSSNYHDQFSDIYSQALNERSFIDADSCYALYNEQGNVGFYYELENSTTELFDEFINELTVRVGVVENVMNETGIPQNINIPVFTYMIDENDLLGLLTSSIITDSVNFNYYDDFSTISGNLDNCEIVFWIQNDESQEIYFAELLPFTEFQPGLVSLDDNEITNFANNIQLFPNPCRSNENMRISFSLPNTIQTAELNIYNIKGQLVRSIQKDPLSQSVEFLWNGRNNEAKPVSSGIYLMQIKSVVNGKTYKHYRKGILLQ